MKYIWLLLFLSLTGCVTGVTIDYTGNNVTSDPGCKYQVYRHIPNSWLLLHPNMKFIFVGNYWNSHILETQNLLNAWTYMSNDISVPSGGTVLERLAEYNISQGETDGTYFNTNTDVDAKANSTNTVIIDDTILISDMNTNIRLGLISTPDDNTLYMIVLPPYFFTKNINDGGLSGYHAHTMYGQTRYAFAIIRYSSLPGMNDVASHELYEAVTNPDGNGYYDDYHGEIGDLCEGASSYIGSYTVQRSWNEGACQCF